MSDAPRFKVGEHIGILRGSYTGKKGVIVKVGNVFLSVEIKGIEGLPLVKKENVIRILQKVSS